MYPYNCFKIKKTTLDADAFIVVQLDLASILSSHEVEDFCATTLEQIKAVLNPLPFIIRNTTMSKLTLDDLKDINIFALDKMQVTQIDKSALTDQHIFFVEVSVDKISTDVINQHLIGIAEQMQKVLSPAKVVVMPIDRVSFGLGLMNK